MSFALRGGFLKNTNFGVKKIRLLWPDCISRLLFAFPIIYQKKKKNCNLLIDGKMGLGFFQSYIFFYPCTHDDRVSKKCRSICRTLGVWYGWARVIFLRYKLNNEWQCSTN